MFVYFPAYFLSTHHVQSSILLREMLTHVGTHLFLTNLIDENKPLDDMTKHARFW